MHHLHKFEARELWFRDTIHCAPRQNGSRGYELIEDHWLRRWGDVESFFQPQGANEVPVLHLTGITHGHVDSFEEMCHYLWPKAPRLISWYATSAEERALQLEFVLKSQDWEWPALFLTGEGLTVLGKLPRRLRGCMKVLEENRLLTYHALPKFTYPEVRIAKPINEKPRTPKQLGKMLSELHRFGFIMPRGYASREQLKTLGVKPADRYGRPQLWESVSAFSREFATAQAKIAADQYSLF